MTRNVLAVVAGLATFAMPLTIALAQTDVGVAAGPTWPRGDFGKFTRRGYEVTGLVNVAPLPAPVGLRFEAGISEIPYTFGGRASRARIVSATGNGVLRLSAIPGPYVIGGVGLYNMVAECATCPSGTTKGGVNGGVGYGLSAGGLSLFAEARCHYIAGRSDPTNGGINSSTQFIPFAVGIRF